MFQTRGGRSYGWLVRTHCLRVLPLVAAVLVGCGEESHNPEYDPASGWITASEVETCLKRMGQEVEGGAFVSGGTEKITISAERLSIGPAGDRDAWVLVIRPKEMLKLRQGSQSVIPGAEQVGSNTFVAPPALDAIFNPQPNTEAVPEDVVERVTECVD